MFSEEETIRLAKENEWWEIEESETETPIPQSAREFYVLWERLDREYISVGDVLCLVPLLGYFDWFQGQIWRVYPRRYFLRNHPANELLTRGGTREPNSATNAELAELDWAIRHGCIQLEVWMSVKKALMMGIEQNPLILLQGTGRPFPAQNR